MYTCVSQTHRNHSFTFRSVILSASRDRSTAAKSDKLSITCKRTEKWKSPQELFNTLQIIILPVYINSNFSVPILVYYNLNQRNRNLWKLFSSSLYYVLSKSHCVGIFLFLSFLMPKKNCDFDIIIVETYQAPHLKMSPKRFTMATYNAQK